MNDPIVQTPAPPYYAVIFTSIKTGNEDGYKETLEKMLQLAAKHPGYIGIESARSEIGITVSYWESTDAIRSWKQQSEHLLAQKKGREKWYEHYRVRVCKVERDYGV